MAKNLRTLENRLEVGAILYCHDEYALHEKVKVKSVDKKEKTALLSNGLTISRYPSGNGEYKCLDKKTHHEYHIKDFEPSKKEYLYHRAFKRLQKYLPEINDMMKDGPKNNPDMVIEIADALTKILKR